LTFGGLLSKQYPTVRPPSQMVAITMIVIGWNSQIATI
jgi:hypothetical protein